jgi:hypothetical protein
MRVCQMVSLPTAHVSLSVCICVHAQGSKTRGVSILTVMHHAGFIELLSVRLACIACAVCYQCSALSSLSKTVLHYFLCVNRGKDQVDKYLEESRKQVVYVKMPLAILSRFSSCSSRTATKTSSSIV